MRSAKPQKSPSVGKESAHGPCRRLGVRLLLLFHQQGVAFIFGAGYWSVNTLSCCLCAGLVSSAALCPIYLTAILAPEPPGSRYGAAAARSSRSSCVLRRLSGVWCRRPKTFRQDIAMAVVRFTCWATWRRGGVVDRSARSRYSLP